MSALTPVFHDDDDGFSDKEIGCCRGGEGGWDEAGDFFHLPSYVPIRVQIRLNVFPLLVFFFEKEGGCGGSSKNSSNLRSENRKGGDKEKELLGT